MGNLPMRKILLFIFSALLCLLCCSGCGQEATPDGIAIECGGEVITALDIVNGSEQSGLRAVISPSDYEGEIRWSSDDSGIVKVSAADGAECTLTAKKTGSAKVTAECGGVSTTIRVHVLKNQQNLAERDTALTVGGVAYSSEVVTLYYADQYYSVLDRYGENTIFYGLDPSLGIESLAEQYCESAADGTWRGLFLGAAEQSIQQTQALCDYAAENGIKLSEEDYDSIKIQVDALDRNAEDLGIDTAEAFLAEYYGEGITLEMYREFLERTILANKAYDVYAESLSYTEEEIAEHYSELEYEAGENDYPVTSMRHILIMAEADENGEYSDAAIAAAHEKAVQIYTEWAAREKSESSFAELANAYSEDSGSNTNGGLYENIYQGQMVDGINEWLFSSARTAGDTAVIDNDGSYVGTHVVYFIGYGEQYSSILSREDLVTNDITAWMTDLTEDYPIEHGADYASVAGYKS